MCHEGLHGGRKSFPEGSGIQVGQFCCKVGLEKAFIVTASKGVADEMCSLKAE